MIFDIEKWNLLCDWYKVAVEVVYMRRIGKVPWHRSLVERTGLDKNVVGSSINLLIDTGALHDGWEKDGTSWVRGLMPGSCSRGFFNVLCDEVYGKVPMSRIMELKRLYNPWKLEPGQLPPEPTDELHRLEYRQMIWRQSLLMMSRRYQTKPEWPFWKVYTMQNGDHVATVQSPTPGGAVSQFAWDKKYCSGRDRIFIVSREEAILETEHRTYRFVKVV